MRKWLPLVAACLGSLMFLVDTTVVTVALPEMPGSLAGLQWVANVYTLVLAVLMLTAGSLADLYGHRDAYLGGLAVFGVASLLCGLAPDVGTLIAARALQGVGGAALAVTTFALAAGSYSGKDRGTAMGVYFAVAGLAAAIGPMLGGALTTWLGWRAIFFVNLPLVVLTVALTLSCLSNTVLNPEARIDPYGMLSFALFAGSLTYALTSGQPLWYAPAAAGLAIFAVVEPRRAHPLLDLRLLARPAFSVVLVCAMAGSVAFAALVYTSIRLQSGDGLDPIHAGLAMTPLALAAFVTSTFGGRFLHGAPPRLTVGLGLLANGLGCLLQVWSLPLGLVVTGIGVGLVGPSMGAAVMASVPAGRGGMAAGAMTTFRQLGQTLGVAVLGVLYQSGHGLDGVYLTAAGIGLAAGVLALAVIRPVGAAVDRPASARSDS
jgi:EmrB/QacA subfamily drug resistance transporter